MNFQGYGPQAKAVTKEEFERWSRNGGNGGGGPPDELGELGKAVRNWAERLIKREQSIIEGGGAASPRQYLENRKRSEDLSRQFRAVADPSTEGVWEAIRVICSYRFGMRTTQPS